MNLHRLARRCVAITAAGIALAAVPLPAHAIQRTFVAANGSDGNDCSLLAPCRSFKQAILQTDAKGEIVVVSSAGYGAVLIDKSVSIIAPSGVYAGISVFTGSGVTIATPGVKVLLRGLTINGQGGSIGIDFSAGGGAELVVEQCTIANMLGDGVSAANLSSRIIVRDSVVRRNGGHGINVSQGTVATIDRSRIESNGLNGILFTFGVWGTMSESIVSGNGGHCVAADSSGAFVLQVSIDRSVMVECQGYGVFATAGNGEIRVAVAHSTIARNSGHAVNIRTDAGNAFGEISDNEITGNGGTGIYVGSGVSTVNAVGNRVTRNLRGYENYGVLRSISNNLIDDNILSDIGTITTVLGK